MNCQAEPEPIPPEEVSQRQELEEAAMPEGV
jgi:hypothetical protein